MTQQLEGWGVRARPAAIGLGLFLVVLIGGVTGADAWYRGHIAPQVRPRITTHPAPALETIQTAPGDHVEPGPPSPPRGIDRAMAAVAAEGDGLWNAR